MKRVLIAAAAIAAALAAAPTAAADESSYIYALEHSALNDYYGYEGTFIDGGYRVCRQLAMGYSPAAATNYIVNTGDFTPLAAAEVVYQAVMHLC